MLTQTWPPHPQFKIEVSGQTYMNDTNLSAKVIRPENNISLTILTVEDRNSSKYVDVFDAFDTLDVSLHYGTDAWTKVFSGIVTTTSPRMSMQGEVLDVLAWGDGLPLLKTGCDESYGVESINNSAVDTPKEILEDLIDNHINKIFGAAAGGNWSIGKKVDNAHSGLSVTFLNSQYQNNFVNVNRVCDLVNAYAQGLGTPEVSTHWFVDPTPNLYFKKIDADHSDGSWDRYWGGTLGTDPGTQASSTIVVGADQIRYDFQKNVEDYANHIILTSLWRMPSEDYWTEDNGGQALWRANAITKTDDNTSIVGSHSLKLVPTGAANAYVYYPGSELLTIDAPAAQKNVTVADGTVFSVGNNVTLWDSTPVTETKTIASIAGDTLTMTENLVNAYHVADAAFCRINASWDFTKCGSPNTIPSLNFWVQKNDNISASSISLCTSTTEYYVMYGDLQSLITQDDVWIYLNLPIGPYHYGQQEQTLKRWVDANGSADWSNINWIRVDMPSDNTLIMYLDDLHFTGTVVREAKDTSEITAHKTWFRHIHNNTAVNDTLTEGTLGLTDVGTAAQLAYAELLRRSQTPVVGIVEIPMAPTLLPGQTIHVHACQQASGTYRVDADFRVKELTHNINRGGVTTTLNLTSDVTNTHAVGAPTAYGLLKQYAGALGHSEARDLKGGSVDNLIPRLSESY